MQFDAFGLPAAAVVILLLLIGIISGQLGAFFGVGGGWVVTPALYLLGMPAADAVGTGMVFIAGNSLLAALQHRRAGQTDLVLGLALGVPMLAGVDIGRRVLILLESRGTAEPVFQTILALFLSAMGVWVLREALRPAGVARTAPSAAGPRPERRIWRLPPRLLLVHEGRRLSVWPLAGVGLATGVFSGLVGVGGGVVLLPFMINGLRIAPVRAVATSLICITLAGASGAVGYGLHGRADFAAAALLLAGALGGIRLGVRAALNVSAGGFRRLFGSMLLFGALAIGLRQAGAPVAAAGVLLGSAGALSIAIAAQAARRRAAAEPGP